MKSPRHWCRLSIPIKIHRSSIYWVATKILQADSTTRHARPLTWAAPLPYSLHTKIQRLLQTEDFYEDEDLQLSLINGNGIQRHYHRSRFNSSSPAVRTSSIVPNVLGFLDDLGCPRYHEHDVTQVELHNPPTNFISCMDGALVYEVKLTGPIPDCELLYNIRVLHCMGGRFGFARLVGIVVDDTGKHLKSYLIEFPQARWSLRQVIERHSIPWERRERWAKQIVEGVSQLHSKGFVVGTLSGGRSPVLVDDSDSIQFWYLESRFHVRRRSRSCYYPPEFRYVQSLSWTMNEEDCPEITSKTDIFHLGRLLWLIAENASQTNTNLNPACIRQRCNEQPGGCNDESHHDSIVLPPLPESILNYYRNIVDACRAKAPNDRHAARRLLETFSLTNEPEPFRQSSGLERKDLSAIGKYLLGSVDCDQCRKRHLQLPFFTCYVCETGDYDICGGCFERGIHYYDKAHLLVEMTKIGSLIIPGKYHSCVKSSGKREVVEL